jgi:hypothetical protein
MEDFKPVDLAKSNFNVGLGNYVRPEKLKVIIEEVEEAKNQLMNQIALTELLEKINHYGIK